MENTQDQLNHIRHSCAHLLAAAVANLYPDAIRTIGPAIENGFYYDFDFQTPISETDLPKIEVEMAMILKTWEKFEGREVTKEEAKKIFKDNPYKLELIDEITSNQQPVTIYHSGDFEDLCRGGHSQNPQKDIGAFKLLSLAGAYWRGSEKNKMLTRIYGTCFPSQKELDAYLAMLEEAKKRDHKKIGKELELFRFDQTAPGMAYWLPNGLITYNTLYSFVRDMYKKYGYTEVATPILNKKDLYETSGHWSHYKDDMFVSDMGENEVFGVKPMNCPNAMKIFSFKTRSYNDLPLRLAETSPLHRFEPSGTLNGLFRIRQFRQDDAHIFITPDQAEGEFESLMKMIKEMYTPFDLKYKLRFGTRPEKALGETKDWELAEDTLGDVLQKSGEEFFKVEGEGAFYGPKVDILMEDSLGREWQTGTIQLDIQQPKRFNLSYIDSDGTQKMPFVFHRAILGSFERFLGILIEHFAGKFPVWLSPIQVSVLPISDKTMAYSQMVRQKLEQKDIRVSVDVNNETLQYKIRSATMQKIPYLLIVGPKEEAENKVSVRTRDGQDLGQMGIEEFEVKILEDIASKSFHA